MEIADKKSYIICTFGLFSWALISFSNYLFSSFFNVYFDFSILKLILIPIFIFLLSILFLYLKVLKFFILDRKKYYFVNQMIFVFMNGVYATFVCITQNNIYNGYSVLFTFLIGLMFLNMNTGFKGKIFLK